MKDLGQLSSYLALQERLPAYSSDGKELGKVEHVLADPDLDVFDGIVLDKSVLPGGHRFVDASQVEEIYQRGVVLTVDATRPRAFPSRAPTRARSRSARTTWSRTACTRSSAAPGTGSRARTERGRRQSVRRQCHTPSDPKPARIPATQSAD